LLKIVGSNDSTIALNHVFHSFFAVPGILIAIV
jgi:hypothetical protein